MGMGMLIRGLGHRESNEKESAGWGSKRKPRHTLPPQRLRCFVKNHELHLPSSCFFNNKLPLTFYSKFQKFARKSFRHFYVYTFFGNSQAFTHTQDINCGESYQVAGGATRGTANAAITIHTSFPDSKIMASLFAQVQ